MLAACSPADGLADGDDAAIAAIAAAPASPVPPPPEAYLRAEDEERARRRVPGERPCAVRGISGGAEYAGSLPIDRCVRMLPRQRFRGVWYNRFEVSVFWPGRETPGDEEPRIWLDVDRAQLRDLPGEQAYLIAIEGRRTMYPGNYGHYGYPHAIVVDRVISARRLD